jgi:CheY-like chemotaxis protein
MGGEDLKSDIGPDYSILVDKTVLMVDDEEEILSTTRAAVAKNVFTIETVPSGNEALDRIKRRDYDFIFLDIRMPQMDGIRLYRNIISHKPYLADKTIFLTGDVDNKKTAEFLKLTRSRYLAKPFSMKALLGVMCEIVNSASTPEKHRS